MDFRDRRLPNVVTLGGLLFFMAYHTLSSGVEGLAMSFVGGTVGFIFLIVPWFYGAAGGGDVKMLAAAGCAVTSNGVMPLLVVTSVSGLLVAFGFIIFGAVGTERLRHLFRTLLDPRYDRKAGKVGLPSPRDHRVRVPFSIPIGLGMVTVLMGGMAG